MLSMWINEHWIDFRTNEELFKDLQAFVSDMSAMGFSKNSMNLRARMYCVLLRPPPAYCAPSFFVHPLSWLLSSIDLLLLWEQIVRCGLQEERREPRSP